MESATVETVTEWDSAPFTDGHAGLRDLADREFTGAVTEGVAWLFMLNGRVIGVFDGSIEDFADADGTAYESPHPSLPLLFAMQETGGETRAKYYSEDTPLSEADRTLKSGKFTGYIELSENVLSGDYYVVYHGGKSMSAAFVGNNSRLVTGDEAFDLADDEVGIYKVKTVDIDIVEIPEPDTGRAAVSDVEEDEGDEDANEPNQGGVTFGGGAEPVADDDESAAPTDDSTPAADDADSTETESEPMAAAETDEEPSEDPLAEPAAEATGPVGAADEGRADAAPESAAEQAAPRQQPEPARDAPPEPAEPAPTVDEPQPADPRAETNGVTDRSVFDEESEWRNKKTIPALDPEQSVDITPPGKRNSSGGSKSSAKPSRSTAQQNQNRRQQSRGTTAGAQNTSGPAGQRLQQAEATLEDLRAERDELAARAEQLATENDRLQEERDQLEQERDSAQQRVATLESEVAELESTIQRLEADLAQAHDELDTVEEYIPEGDRELSVDRALEGTNLFVRYRRKSGPTLDDAHDGTASREEINENLRLEHHTDFDSQGVIVDGQPFSEWLQRTVEYGFGRWLVEEFAHDIRETRNQTALEDLFEAIPDIDRIEFNGAIDIHGADGGTDSRTFDVVVRDRMGEPLAVADFNDSREPATEAMLGSLIENATPVAEVDGGLAGAFFITTSYFEPGALETAHDATGGGLLRRERRKSYVKLSRKQGYHLCLVETRNGEFHVNVPEL